MQCENISHDTNIIFRCIWNVSRRESCSWDRASQVRNKQLKMYEWISAKPRAEKDRDGPSPILFSWVIYCFSFECDAYLVFFSLTPHPFFSGAKSFFRVCFWLPSLICMICSNTQKIFITKQICLHC